MINRIIFGLLGVMTFGIFGFIGTRIDFMLFTIPGVVAAVLFYYIGVSLDEINDSNVRRKNKQDENSKD